MNERTLQAFLDELEGMEKDAFLGQAARGVGRWIASRPGQAARSAGSVGRWIASSPRMAAGWAKKQPGEFATAGKRMLSPIKSTKAGWRRMTPAKELEHLRAQPFSPENLKKIEEFKKGLGRHITEGPTAGAGRIQRAAEALSRRGWTGKGRITKYIPGWSQKGMYAGFGGLSAAEIARAAKKDPTRTGEGGLFETGLGEGLGTAAFIAGTGGLGFLPATAMWLAAQKGGASAGRVIDRLRGGASLGTAVNAPTPTEADQMIRDLESQSPEEQQKTIDTLRRYYG